MHSCYGLPQHVLIFCNRYLFLTITGGETGKHNYSFGLFLDFPLYWTWYRIVISHLTVTCMFCLIICSDISQYLSVLNNIWQWNKKRKEERKEEKRKKEKNEENTPSVSSGTISSSSTWRDKYILKTYWYVLFPRNHELKGNFHKIIQIGGIIKKIGINRQKAKYYFKR